MLSVLESFFLHVEHVFSFLVLNSLYSLLLALVVLFFKLIFPKMPRRLEYGLWCLVIIRLVLPTDFSISYSLGSLGHTWFEQGLPNVVFGSEWVINIVNQAIFFDFNQSLTWFKLLQLIWLCVSLTVAFNFISLKLKLVRLLSVARPVEDHWIVKKINHWRIEFNIRRRIIVVDSNDFLSPFTFAVVLPVVFIPTRILEQKNTKVIEPIIAHELAHVSRFDALWLFFQNTIQIVFSLNPVVWLAVRRLNALREEICDQKVLDTQQIANDEYGKSLLNVLRLNIGQRSPELFATFFLSHKSVFKKRIAAIGRNQSSSMKAAFQYAITALFALFFLPLSWQKTFQQEAGKVEQDRTNSLSPFPDDIRKNFKPTVLETPSVRPEIGSRKKRVEILTD